MKKIIFVIGSILVASSSYANNACVVSAERIIQLSKESGRIGYEMKFREYEEQQPSGFFSKKIDNSDLISKLANTRIENRAKISLEIKNLLFSNLKPAFKENGPMIAEMLSTGISEGIEAQMLRKNGDLKSAENYSEGSNLEALLELESWFKNSCQP